MGQFDHLQMQESCRDHKSYAAFAGAFPLPGDKPQYPRDRVADIKHVSIDITLDLDNKRLSGNVSHTFTPLNNGLETLEIDSVELDIGAVRSASGVELAYSLSDGRLRIELGQAINPGSEETINVEFSGSPRRGLYFIGPDEGYPEKRLEAWTQGEDEDSRHWFPCYDYPNEMATSEIHVTLREPFIAIANGRLVNVEPGRDPNTRTFHFHQEQPHAAYLTSVVAGEFAQIRDEWEGIPILYYVPVGREEEGRELFKNTPEMMRLFSERTGTRYPYAKYSQVVVQDFIFGGMENVSATTVTENVLYDARARLDADGEYLVAHEIAHQWFGDLLTCRDWSHGWLNEGFATFMELYWMQHKKGQDEFLFGLRGEFDNYIGESGRYQRPIVTNVYNAPIDLFDRHLYEKGGIVLNMLRSHLGNDLFWKAIRHYVVARRGKNVVTPDLQRAIEDATGRNLDWFFDQWVYGAGHPTMTGSYSWDDKTNSAKISLKQMQSGDKVAEVFRLPLRLDFKLENGDTSTTKVEMTDKEQTFFVPLTTKPKYFNVDGEVLKTLELEQSPEMLRTQLAEDENVLGRVDAARALGKKGDKDAIASLGKAVRQDAFWGVQAEAARALGGIRSGAALDELLASTKVEHPKARRSVLRALGEFRDEKAADALLEVVNDGDASYYAEAWATAALGKTRSSRAFEALQSSLTKESQNDVIRASVFQGFADLRDERGIDILTEWSRYGHPLNSRGTAASALAKLGEVVPEHRKEDITDHLITLVDDPWFRTSISAIDALADLKATKALPHLNRAAESALDGRTVRVARLAAKAIREGSDKGDEVKKLREEVDKMTDENRSLRDRLEAIEAKLG
jgi:aminopeptidase N